MQLSLVTKHGGLSLLRQKLGIINWPFGSSGMIRAQGDTPKVIGSIPTRRTCLLQNLTWYVPPCQEYRHRRQIRPDIILSL